jgi:diguanylate cyclase (GGDEF)-like protein
MLFRSIRYRIAAVFVGLLLLVMALIMALVTGNSTKILDAEMVRELDAGAHIYSRLVEQNQRQLETAVRVLAADFAFREAIATQDRPTVLSVLRNHGGRIGAKVMMVATPDRQLIADTQRPGEPPHPFPFPALLDAAESRGLGAGVELMRDGRLYQIVVVPILAPVRIAWVAMGFPIDDAWASELSAMTRLEICIVDRQGDGAAPQTLLASSLNARSRSLFPAAFGHASGQASPTLQLAEERFQTRQIPLGRVGTVVLLRSLDQVEAPFRSLQTALIVIVLGGIVVFVVGSLWFSTRLAGPIDSLAAAARRFEAGDYEAPLPVSGADEIGQLTASFGLMREGIVARESKILRLAYEDTLTGLPNRTRYLEVLEKMPASAIATMVVLNIDRFRLINEALGHSVGDRLLLELAHRLVALRPERSLLARLGGDEFAYLIEGADELAAKTFCDRLVRAARDPVEIDGQRLDVGVSLGVALYPQDGANAATLLRRADLAMRVAKKWQSGVAFATQGQEPKHEQLSLVGEMREALENQEFQICYQPKLHLRDGRIYGAEALLRWSHPQRGLVPPGRFIPFAEQTGFIREITPWLLSKVISQGASWRDAGLSVVPSINLSAPDLLNRGLPDLVRRLLLEHRLSPDAICLEITESALMEDPELAQQHLAVLAQLGVKLSIDDYGVGQASLAYVRNLPVHELKIDQTFTRSLGNSAKDAAIVRSTIAMGHALGLTVVAEGVETAADLDWLRAHGCDIAQGYWIARPMSAAELSGWLSDSARLSPDAGVHLARPGAQ